MLLKELAKDLVTHGYTNMSVEYSNYDGHSALAIKEYEEPHTIRKTVFYTDGDKILVDYFSKGHFVGNDYFSADSFGWNFGNKVLYVFDDTIKCNSDALRFGLGQDSDIIIA